MTTINTYFADNYGKWLNRARQLCHKYHLPQIDATDILHDSLCVVLVKMPNEIEHLMTDQISNDATSYTLLDLYISRVISNKLMNLGQHKKVIRKHISDVDINKCLNYSAL